MLHSLFFGNYYDKKKPQVSHIEFSQNMNNRIESDESVGNDDTSSSSSDELSGIEINRRDSRKLRLRRKRLLRFRMNTSSTSSSQKKEKEKYKFSNSDFDVIKIAWFSRIIILILQVFARTFLPLHQNDGFQTLHLQGNFLDHIVNSSIGGFTNWDGQYFVHIASQGYTHINTIAFFPLFPITIGYISHILHVIPFKFLSIHSIILIVGWLFNTYIFIETAKTLQQLVKYMDRGMNNLIPCVIFIFCFNPASIFFSAFYSECLFSYLTFNVLLALYKRKLKNAVFFAGLGAVCRSNGLLNFGFIGAFVVRDAICEQRINKNGSISKLCIIYDIVHGILISIVGLFPFFYFQMFCIWKFCDRIIKSKADLLPFCELEILPYSYVQETNWNVGFMGYFETKQIPNFLLAGPILIITGYEAYKRVYFYSKSVLFERYIGCLPDLAMSCHALFLVLFCVFFAHVQISTRMILSSCPYLYIYIAKTIRSETYQFRSHEIDWLGYSFTIHTWCMVYFIIGTIGFSLGYPWT